MSKATIFDPVYLFIQFLSILPFLLRHKVYYKNTEWVGGYIIIQYRTLNEQCSRAGNTKCSGHTDA